MPQHLFLCPDTGRPHFIPSESALTDCFSLPTTAVQLAAASCQALLRGRQLPLNVQILDGTAASRVGSQWVHVRYANRRGLVLFYLIVLNAVPSKWRLLLTRVISYL